MTPVGLTADGGITYGMTGMFAEIFDNLQVSLVNHILVIDFCSSFCIMAMGFSAMFTFQLDNTKR